MDELLVVIILRRLSAAHEESTRANQAGFKPGRGFLSSCADSGIDLLPGGMLSDLQYPDDIVLLSEDPENYLLIDEIILIPEFVNLNCTYQDIVEVVHGDSKLRFSIRGSKVRLKPLELNKDRDVMISKKLSWILRHGAQKVGLTYGVGGYLFLDDVLRLQDFSGISVEDVQRVVENNNKQRFELSVDPETGRRRIRAFQGHSVKIEGLELIPITDASEFPVVIHGTYWRNWEQIKREGLNRMNRTHIHFAPGEIGQSGVISGMRNSVDVVIYIDLAAALRDGYKFFLSSNRVILTEGDANGSLPPKYFAKVFQCRPHPSQFMFYYGILVFNWWICSSQQSFCAVTCLTHIVNSDFCEIHPCNFPYIMQMSAQSM
ncbi:unnamed protein product [Echinostoma caproni]|uniref:2'-phosphotransferase n=1 Tax=Echinostoma caproni TaxID=27848 RepID=A0A3P8GMR0_9TREM|nr:unnamed protein product [Echinostoma caproni]